jgi:uncharacterized membrane protein
MAGLVKSFKGKCSILDNKHIKLLPGILLFLFGCIYFTIVICNHYFFRTYCFDYGVYNFTFYDFAHFHISNCPLYFRDNMTFLQDHVSFTLMLFIPFYWVFGWITGTYTLLLIQTLLILTGGWYIYKLVEFKTSHRLLSILALLQYLFIYGRWTMFGADCNFAIIASSMIPVLLYHFEKKTYFFMFLVLLFVLISREDMALWTFFIGLFLFIKNYKDSEHKKVSLAVMAISVIYFITVFKVVIPSLETDSIKYSLFNYSSLGRDPWEAFLFILNHPLKTMKLLFINTSGNPLYDNLKLEFYYIYLLCGGFLLFYRPAYLLLFIPILAKKMLNDEPLRWSSDTYYSVEFISMLPYAVFLILSEIKKKYLKAILIGVVCVGTVFITIYKLGKHKDSSVFWLDSKHAFYKSKFYRADFDIRKAYQKINLIPSEAIVSATGTIVPHLAWRPKIYNFPKVLDAEYIVVFADRDTYPISRIQFDAELKSYLNNNNWKVIANDFPLLILKKGGNPD